jgi:hypothetical protein
MGMYAGFKSLILFFLILLAPEFFFGCSAKVSLTSVEHSMADRTDVGLVVIGTSRVVTVEVKNQAVTGEAAGIQNLRMRSALQSAFALEGGHFPGAGGTCGSATVPAGDSCTVVLRFTPVARMEYASDLEIEYDVLGQKTGVIHQQVVGRGGDHAAVTLLAQNFGPTPLVGYRVLPVDVTNSGDVPARTLSWSMTGSVAYTVVEDHCGLEVAPHGTCQLMMRFTPWFLGSVNATLSLQYDTGLVLDSSSADMTGAGTENMVKLHAQLPKNAGHYGRSLAASPDGQFLAVGSDQNAGGLEIYMRDSSGGWTMDTLVSGGPIDSFGVNLTWIDAQTLAVADLRRFDSSESQGGVVFIYQKVNGVWSVMQTIESPLGEVLPDYSFFGNAMAAHGDWLVICAPYYWIGLPDDAGYRRGAAWIYKRINGLFIAQQMIVAPDAWSMRELQFGSQVSIQGDDLIFPVANNIRPDGLIFHYQLQGAAWNFVDTITKPGVPGNMYFSAFFIGNGRGAILADGGNTIIAGARVANTVYVLKRNATGMFVLDQTITPPFSYSGSFGTSVAYEADTLIVGASTALSTRGAALLYKRTSANGAFTFVREVAQGSASGNQFGLTVSLQGGVFAGYSGLWSPGPYPQYEQGEVVVKY